MSFFKTQDQKKIFYRESGDGAPVILIHGWPLNSDMWEYQKLSLLRAGHRVITYDRRGFGHSTQPSDGYNYDILASDLNDLIEHLELTKVAIVGFSMGGGEIARYLTRYGSSKVSCATLISAVTPYLYKDASNPEGVEATVFDKMVSGLEQDRPHFLAGFTKQFFGENLIQHPVSTETETWCMNMALTASLKASIDCVHAFGKTDFRSDMKAFVVPTLIIHGSADKTVPMKVAGETAAKLIPNATFKVYDGAPHGLFITHMRELNADLGQFLSIHQELGTNQSFRKVNTAIGFVSDLTKRN